MTRNSPDRVQVIYENRSYLLPAMTTGRDAFRAFTPIYQELNGCGYAVGAGGSVYLYPKKVFDDFECQPGNRRFDKLGNAVYYGGEVVAQALPVNWDDVEEAVKDQNRAGWGLGEITDRPAVQPPKMNEVEGDYTHEVFFFNVKKMRKLLEEENKELKLRKEGEISWTEKRNLLTTVFKVHVKGDSTAIHYMVQRLTRIL